MAKAQVRVLPSARNTVMVVDDQSTGRAILEQVVRSIDERVGVEGFARECLARCRNLLMLRRQALALEDRRRLLEHMVEDATKEVREREKETLLRLARAGEFRDEETGYHLIRMSRYSRLIAGALGLEHDEAETIELSAPLHDIGKIGIPD